MTSNPTADTYNHFRTLVKQFCYDKTEVDNLCGNDVSTFTDLQSLITSASSGDTIILNKDYKYNSTTDSSLTNGVTIPKNITIMGNGHIIDGNNSKRAFYLEGYTLQLKDLTIQNGYDEYYGGAIFSNSENQARVVLENCNFINNNAGNIGGAIFNNGGTLAVVLCDFVSNTTGDDGAVYNSGGSLSMYDSFFLNNYSTNDGFVDIYSTTSKTVYNCKISNINTSCYNITNSNYLTQSTIVDNLITDDATKVLSAKQGKALKDLIGEAISYINK